MASPSPSPSTPPPISPDAPTPNTVNGEGGDVKGDVVGESSLRLVLEQSGMVREEQVQNAVNFLLHPKVRGSPVVYRRSFLQRKGLTNKEIDEAFRRAPDPVSSDGSVEEIKDEQAKQSTLSANLHSSQLASAPHNNIPLVSNLQQPRFHWSQSLLAIGILAASGAGTAVVVQTVVIPWLKTWIKRVVAEEDDTKLIEKTKPNLAEEVAEAAKAASSSAAALAVASQLLLDAKKEERRYLENFMEKIYNQTEEMKSIRNTIQKLEKPNKTYNSEPRQIGEYVQSKSWNSIQKLKNSKQTYNSEPRQIEEYMQSKSLNGTANHTWGTQVSQSNANIYSLDSKHLERNGTHSADMGTVSQSSPSTSMDPTLAPHPKSYIEIIEMIQRGEKPPNIKDINDMPPNPNQPISKPVLAPRPKPWEVNRQAHQMLTQDNPQGLGSGEIRHLNHGSSSGLDAILWRKNQAKTTQIEPPELHNLWKNDYVPERNERQSPTQPPEDPVDKVMASNGHPNPFLEKEASVDDENLAKLSSVEENETTGIFEAISIPENSTSIMSDFNKAEMQEPQVGVKVY